MTITTQDEANEHFLATMGNIPEPIAVIAKYMPEYFLGYVNSRVALYKEPPHAHLDLKTKELIYTLLDIAVGNLDGALNHAAAGVRAGMTEQELCEGCMLVIVCFGVPSFGKIGYKVVEHVAKLRNAAASNGG